MNPGRDGTNHPKKTTSDGLYLSHSRRFKFSHVTNFRWLLAGFVIITFSAIAAVPPTCKLQVCFMDQSAEDSYECDSGCVFEKNPLNVGDTAFHKLEQYEGRQPKMYLDTVNKVTVGIGHMLEGATAAADLTFYKALTDGTERQATEQEIKSAFAAIEGHPQPSSCTSPPAGQGPTGCHTAGYYSSFTGISMHDDDIDALAKKDIEQFGGELHTLYPDFDTYPTKVQVALYDMIFNLGQTKLTSKFPSFNTAIRDRDWQKAADESHRVGISEDRNNYVKDLLEVSATAGAAAETKLNQCPASPP